jgi:hypothetical protein
LNPVFTSKALKPAASACGFEPILPINFSNINLLLVVAIKVSGNDTVVLKSEGFINLK